LGHGPDVVVLLRVGDASAIQHATSDSLRTVNLNNPVRCGCPLVACYRMQLCSNISASDVASYRFSHFEQRLALAHNKVVAITLPDIKRRHVSRLTDPSPSSILTALCVPMLR
jgi:hypothetical protein